MFSYLLSIAYCCLFTGLYLQHVNDRYKKLGKCRKWKTIIKVSLTFALFISVFFRRFLSILGRDQFDGIRHIN